MAKFVSGDLRIDIKFNDRTDQYQVKLCPRGRTVEKCERVNVRPPASGSRSTHGKRLSVDDPRAFKQAASSAISFASERIQQHADYSSRRSGWLVKPARRK